MHFNSFTLSSSDRCLPQQSQSLQLTVPYRNENWKQINWFLNWLQLATSHLFLLIPLYNKSKSWMCFIPCILCRMCPSLILALTHWWSCLPLNVQVCWSGLLWLWKFLPFYSIPNDQEILRKVNSEFDLCTDLCTYPFCIELCTQCWR